MKLDNISASIPDDRDFPYVPLKDAVYPLRLDLKPEVFEIEDQLTVGSCTCNSSVSACEMLADESLSRLFPYWTTRNLVGNYPGQDGASLRDAVRSLYHYGTPLEIRWPYDVTKVNVRPEDEVFNAATIRKVTRYENIDIPVLKLQGFEVFQNTLKSVLSEGLGIVVATRIGKEIGALTGPWQGHKMHPVDSGINSGNGNTYVGNHATLLIGYDDTTVASFPTGSRPGALGSWLVQNSWGPQYGDGGFFGYSYPALYFDCFEAWIIRGFKDVLVQPPIPSVQYITQPAEVLQWFHNMHYWDSITDPMNPAIQFWAMRGPDYGSAKREFYNTVKDNIVELCNLYLNQASPP